MRFLAGGLTVLALALLDCSARPLPLGDGGRDAAGDTNGAPCGNGQFSCFGDNARTCDGMGGFTATVNCHDQGLVCAPLLGCATCVPGSHRCSDVDPQQTQVCAPDGSAWMDDAMCDLGRGLSCVLGLCEDRCHPTTPTYLGCEYWPTVTVNSQLPPSFNFAVVVANPNTYDVVLDITGGALSTPIHHTIFAQSVDRPVHLPWVADLAQNGRNPVTQCGGPVCIGTSAAHPNGAYHLTTNGPVAVYQYNPIEYRTPSQGFAFSADSSLLLPTNVLTGHYTVVAHQNFAATDHAGHPAGTLGGFVSLVGVSAATTSVMVNLTAAIGAGPGVSPIGMLPNTAQYALRQGDVIQLVASSPGQDLSGTTIIADHPIAVFTGHDCTQIPADRPACDHLEEQLFPNETWGKHYAVSQLRDRSADEQHVVRITSEQANLTLQFDGIATPPACAQPLAAAHFCEFQTASSFQVSGATPFLVMQYMLGQGPVPPECTPVENPPDLPQCAGDPGMATEVPVEQFRTQYDFLIADSWSRNLLNVVVPDGVTVRLDMVPLTGASVSVGAGFHVFFVPVMPGVHHISTDSQQGFGIKIYGIAPYTSYMHPGGLDLAQIAPPG